jgi:hypothetical protein
MLIESLNRSKEIEDSIIKINPNFAPGDRGLNAQILRALEENRRG